VKTRADAITRDLDLLELTDPPMPVITPRAFLARLDVECFTVGGNRDASMGARRAGYGSDAARRPPERLVLDSSSAALHAPAPISIWPVVDHAPTERTGWAHRSAPEPLP